MMKCSAWTNKCGLEEINFKMEEIYLCNKEKPQVYACVCVRVYIFISE